MLHCHQMPLTKYKFKDRIVKNFKPPPLEHEIEGGAFLITGPIKDAHP